MTSIICALCQQEIGQIVPGAAGISAPGIRDSKSGSTFYFNAGCGLNAWGMR
jgi:hypothetical protein